ncbi:MAG: NADH-quinone oxidoreductase subunit M [Scytolyngbya sp. HA4215-MV1]|jgi:NAD(P)H-quinone oxidoreductase subunit 4|nr:NADH-quinone oxidoreductase subunit M [Scytolyngbya sp. HA4215-MV1]
MLSALIWIPLLGAVLVTLLPSAWGASYPRFLSLGLIGATVIVSILLGIQFDPSLSDFQFTEQLPWIEPLGLNYQLGVDGLAFPLLVMNAVLTLIALWSSDRFTVRPRLYYTLMLLLNASVSGAFLAQNVLLFFIFYEIELIPLYLLIAIWGGPRRGYAATKFLIYTAVSGVLILIAFLGLAWLTGSTTFDYAVLKQQTLPLTVQVALLGALLVGFGIKIPLVPFHTWLPDAHVEASTPISVLLAGVLLKLGTYGLFRFGLGMFPDAWVLLSPWLASWAVVSVLYGSFTAIAQKDMKKMVAYSSIGHMGFILLAGAAASPLSMLGAVMQMVSHGLISGLLFLLVGGVYAKTGSRDIDLLRGLLNPERGLPVLGSLMVLGAMASAGIPGMVGFMAEFLVFRGSFPVFPVQTLLCMIGTGLTAVYLLLLVNKVFFGRLSESVMNLPRVRWAERLPAISLALLVVTFGIQPIWLSRWTEVSTTTLVSHFPTIAQVTAAQTAANSDRSEERMP